MSSILKIAMAASVANLIDFILLMSGSNTPASKLFLTVPLSKSRPEYLRFLYFSSVFSWAVECRTINFANSSVASSAALRASCLGMIYRASANSEITVRSLLIDL